MKTSMTFRLENEHDQLGIADLRQIADQCEAAARQLEVDPDKVVIKFFVSMVGRPHTARVEIA